jgi:hypothetical protein
MMGVLGRVFLQTWPPSLSDMCSHWDDAQARIFAGFMISMGVVMAMSRYGASLLRVNSAWEKILFDLMVPVGIIMIGVVPTTNTRSGAPRVMASVHNISGGR